MLFGLQACSDSSEGLHDVVYVFLATGDQVSLFSGLHLWWITDQLYSEFVTGRMHSTYMLILMCIIIKSKQPMQCVLVLFDLQHILVF